MFAPNGTSILTEVYPCIPPPPQANEIKADSSPDPSFVLIIKCVKWSLSCVCIHIGDTRLDQKKFQFFDRSILVLAIFLWIPGWPNNNRQLLSLCVVPSSKQVRILVCKRVAVSFAGS